MQIKPNTCFQFTNNSAWALKKRAKCSDFAKEREGSHSSCFLLHRFHLCSEVKEVAHAEALGHREIPFPKPQPLLSALLLLSVDIIFWAALQSKLCTNYIYYSLRILRSLMYIFNQESFSATPLQKSYIMINVMH